MAAGADRAAPFLDVADPAFSVRSAQVRQARQASWYARTSYTALRCCGTIRWRA